MSPSVGTVLLMAATTAFVCSGCLDWGRDFGGFYPPGTDAGTDAAEDSGRPMVCGCQNWTVRNPDFDPGTVSFATDITPVLNGSCAILGAMCHGGGGLFDLLPGIAYPSMFGVASTQVALNRIEPGSPESSYLIHKILGTHEDVGGFGCRMPRLGECLPPDVLQTFWVWIEQGPPDN